MMKDIDKTYQPPEQHWVGDGFPVRSLFSYANHGKDLSPFLLFDFAGPYDFSPASHPRGVELHPHRGFETVTIIYKGEVAHRDSAGQMGSIGPGDVQWMTAARGVLHEEFHSQAFTESGGQLLMAQLWVNLPAREKMSAPRYQSLSSKDIPVITLDDQSSFIRIIAGEYAGKKGLAKTVTPMQVWDLHLKQGSCNQLILPEHWSTALVVMSGAVKINHKEIAREAQLVLFKTEGEKIILEAKEDSIVLLLSGEPINEPVKGRGPFVMNTQLEISQAIKDYTDGKFGEM